MSRLHRILAVGVAIGAFALVAVAERLGTGAVAQQMVAPFTEVEFTLPGHLTLLRGDSPSVGISAEPQQLEAIEVVVDSGRLVIRADDRGWLRRVDLDDVKVQVSYQALRALQIAGSGDYTADALLSQSARLNIAGSGSARLQVSDRISGSVAGSGDLFYFGEPEVAVRVQGSGQVNRLAKTL